MRFPEDCYCQTPRRKAKKGVHGAHLALFGLRLRWLANRLHRGGNESGEAPKGGSVRLKMAKRLLKLTLRIPPYERPRNKWRKKLHEVIRRKQRSSPVRYSENDKLEVEVRLYIKGAALTMHDVDNRLKDVLDALQGRAGGSKKRRTLNPIIPNDRQIYRVIMEKGPPPKQSHGLGHLTIRKFRAWEIVQSIPIKRSKST